MGTINLSIEPLQLLLSLILLIRSIATEPPATTTTTTPSLLPTSLSENILNSTRQSNASPLSLVSIAGDVLGDIVNNVLGIFDTDVAKREKWVNETVRRVSEQASGSNVLVFHNNASARSLQGAVRHEHFEMNRFWGLASYGYELYAFDRGTFRLAGDAARFEWGCIASCRDDRASSLGGTYIEFCDPKTGQGPDKVTAGSTTTMNAGVHAFCDDGGGGCCGGGGRGWVSGPVFSFALIHS